MTEESGDGVEIGSSHERHGGIAVTCGMEGDMFGDEGFLCPLCECLLYGDSGWEGEDGLVGMSHRGRKASESVGIEFIGDGFLGFLHDDGVAVIIACLVDVAPSDMADIAETKSCEATEKESLFDLLIGAWGVCEPDDFIDVEEWLDDDGALRHVAALHMGDGVAEKGLVGGGLGKHALEGAEVMVGGDTREPFACVGACMLEVFGESSA